MSSLSSYMVIFFQALSTKGYTHVIRNEVSEEGAKGGESPEKLAKTTDMCLSEKKTSAKGKRGR